MNGLIELLPTRTRGFVAIDAMLPWAIVPSTLKAAVANGARDIEMTQYHERWLPCFWADVPVAKLDAVLADAKAVGVRVRDNRRRAA
jgi:hypothetical protein